MTETHVSALWQQAEDNLTVANLCLSRGYHRIVVSHSYYAVMYAAKAVLLHITGKHINSHKGVQRVFGIALVKPGLVSSEWGGGIGRLHDLRRRADYDVLEIFDESTAITTYDRAKAFLGYMQPFMQNTADGVD